MRSPLPLLVLVLALAAGAAAAQGEPDAANKPLLGIAGQADRFESQTGQDSQVRHIFLGWGQGSSRGTPFARLFAGLKPIPMIHIGTDRGGRVEAIHVGQKVVLEIAVKTGACAVRDRVGGRRTRRRHTRRRSGART